jgi:TetR/AcrR family transcriptional regulator, regulator of autoinduction and epiphytic fitness
MTTERSEPTSSDEEAESTDKRRVRRAANRQAVVEAMISLYADGQYTPTAVEIAERAGLSVRSVFRYFDDVDDLGAAAIAYQESQAYPLLALDARPEDPLADRIARLVESRVRQYELLAPAAHAARAVAHRRPAVAAKLAEINGIRREQVRTLFAAELESMSPPAADRTLATVDVLCSFESHQFLRSGHALAPDVLVAHLTETLAVLLQPSRG